MKVILSVLIITLVFVANAKVPVYVMLPLKTVTDDGKGLVDRNFLSNAFQRLKNNAGLDGIMVDVWWGIVERNSGQYTWDGYLQLMELLKQVGLKAEVVMSFHQCGGNVGDDCNIPIPQFVRNVGNSNPDIYYTDRAGHRNPEYISLGSDDQPLFSGRTPVQLLKFKLDLDQQVK
jgi:beta-amylase